MDVFFDRKFDEKQVVILNDIKFLPTKEEFYKKEDEAIGEIQKLRDEIVTINHQYMRTNTSDLA